MRSSTAARGAAGGEAAAAAGAAPPMSQPEAQRGAQAGAQDPAHPDRQDVGDVVHLEHINLEVPDLDLARVFYSEGLGLTADPDSLGWQRGGPFITWYNIGRQQLHICKGPVAQNTRGTIVLKLPSLDGVARRLALLEPVLEGTAFAFSTLEQQPQQGDPPNNSSSKGSASSNGGGSNGGGGSPGASSLAVTDPWGQRFLLVETAPGFPWPGGLVELRLPCFQGTSHQIARFYSELLGARVVEGHSGSDSGGGGSGGSSGGGVGVESGKASRVYLGPGCCLRFEEDEALGDLNPQAVEQLWTGWHIAFYLTRFSPAFQKTLALGINQLDHPYRDKSPDVASALANHQFRFKDVVHLDAFGKHGELLYRLGHEVRSLHHPGFLRPLYNRR